MKPDGDVWFTFSTIGSSFKSNGTGAAGLAIHLPYASVYQYQCGAAKMIFKKHVVGTAYTFNSVVNIFKADSSQVLNTDFAAPGGDVAFTIDYRAF